MISTRSRPNGISVGVKQSPHSVFDRAGFTRTSAAIIGVACARFRLSIFDRTVTESTSASKKTRKCDNLNPDFTSSAIVLPRGLVGRRTPRLCATHKEVALRNLSAPCDKFAKPRRFLRAAQTALDTRLSSPPQRTAAKGIADFAGGRQCVCPLAVFFHSRARDMSCSSCNAEASPARSAVW